MEAARAVADEWHDGLSLFVKPPFGSVKSLHRRASAVSLRQPSRMRAIVDEYQERVLIGVQELMTYYGKDLKGANLAFNFLLLQSAWSAEAIAQLISEYDGHSPREHGRTGCCEIMTTPGSQRESEAGRRGSLECC
jgi:hypothetical protein